LFFAEDFRMIDGYPTDQILHLIETQDVWTSYLTFGGLFTSLNDPEDTGRHGCCAAPRT
jgi:hypothetical protein